MNRAERERILEAPIESIIDTYHPPFAGNFERVPGALCGWCDAERLDSETVKHAPDCAYCDFRRAQYLDDYYTSATSRFAVAYGEGHLRRTLIDRLTTYDAQFV